MATLLECSLPYSPSALHAALRWAADLAAAVVGLLPEGVLQKLRALAGAQLSNGSRGCIKTYAEARRWAVLQAAWPALASAYVLALSSSRGTHGLASADGPPLAGMRTF